MKRIQFNLFIVETTQGIDYFTDLCDTIEFLKSRYEIDAFKIQLELQSNLIVKQSLWKMEKLIIKGCNDGNWTLVE